MGPLPNLYNKSLSTCDIPQDWKLAHVTAVFKKGKKSSPSNYRPVSLTVNLCKVFESIVRQSVIFCENSRNVDEHFSLFFLKNFTETKESRFGYFS